MGASERELETARGLADSQTQMAPAAVPVVQTSPLHSQTVRDLLGCCRAWEPDVRILGNVRAGDAAASLERLINIETAAKLACGLLWMTAEWRQGKTDAAYQALLEAVGGSGSQGLRECIEAAFAAGHEVDAPPGCYWHEEEIDG